MDINLFLAQFEAYSNEETKKIFSVFLNNKVDIKLCKSFYELILQSREIGYKFNAYIYYEPFENKEVNANWDFFIIRNKKEILLKVFYTSNYDIQRIEDNLTALYY